MKILALDAAGVTCSASVCVDGKTVASMFIANGLTHSVNLLPSVQNVLSLAGLGVSDLDTIACTVGPGSFTGVKIAVSTVKGLAYAQSIPCFAVSSLEALAFNFTAYNGIICPVLDARRNMLYNALFKVENGVVTRLCEDRQIAADELARSLDELARSLEGQDPIICGDGTQVFMAAAEKLGLNAVAAPDKDRFIRAESVALAAINGHGTACDAMTLASVYLRPPQAERERLEREKSENNG